MNERNAAQLHLNIVQTRVPGGVKWCTSDQRRSWPNTPCDQSNSAEGGTRKCVILESRDNVRHTVARVPHDACRACTKRRDKTDWIGTFMAGTLNVSNMICVIHCQKALGSKDNFTVSKTRCSSGATLSKV